MKNLFYTLMVLFFSFTVVSCSDDEPLNLSPGDPLYDALKWDTAEISKILDRTNIVYLNDFDGYKIHLGESFVIEDYVINPENWDYRTHINAFYDDGSLALFNDIDPIFVMNEAKFSELSAGKNLRFLQMKINAGNGGNTPAIYLIIEN